jgi:hypothetical protein
LLRNFTCDLKIFEYDEQNWRNLSYGLIQGLYRQPPMGKNCVACTNFSADMVSINRGYVALELAGDLWKNFNTMLNQSPFKIFTSLVSITILFYDLFMHVDKIFKNSFLMNIPNVVV